MSTDPGRGLTERHVTAQGRRFRTVVAGQGRPLVVFEAGLGGSSAVWAEVQRQVAVHTATVSYDRAGYVGSQRAKDDRRLTDLSRDLEAVIDATGHVGPVILVGQSWGCPIVRTTALATRRPLAGIVLVDGTNSVALEKDGAKPLLTILTWLARLSRTGLHRPVRRLMLKGVTTGLADDDAARVAKDMLSGRTARTILPEAKGLVAEGSQGLAALQAKGFPDEVPVVYLTAGSCLPVAAAEEQLKLLISSQTEEAELRGARQVLVEDSLHDIHMQKPTVVADEIIALVQRFAAVPS